MEQSMDRTTRGILEVARSVLAELDLDVVLYRVLEAAQDLTDARYAALGVLSESKTELARSSHGAEVHEDPRTVHVSVRDDGCGFDPDADTDGFGILGMRERVELLGGELQIVSAPARGATVRARLPARRRSDRRLAG
jgi:glucose-6-phosphate-specific signal transduction histidine kinase